ncbi:DNA polymerase III subunit gamma/tau [Planktothrix mougeotii]|uniref:DNA polymerase III subunit gamma/tau n=1 Tax=Planktothrix mougeotii LEGE 06226 TaxID=1828728 RepID=A0ABR9UEU9_9CYAN|nr:DNA polymerase III subunit gamma/tau [Planktothrix mougeotii]MBE9144993.1 DNA polymerase III subunit gamma/tau [Planktothrix mougeotii LEGE 06226]
MSYEPLHHKYRPQTFAHLVGQEAIATTLTNAIESQRIAPAYLFTGPRGTGKTSSARILAKSLNCLATGKPTATPCGVCDVCKGITNGSTLDVIEIDAASNTGVDNIRELIERSQFAPVQCRYKVYVVDECHMLSTAAFNALLKTLEEPPDRVVFVLATTDPQRVLATIISRCQRFDFRRIPLDSMVKHLHYIAQQENINIVSDAIFMVAQIAQGGLRDAESLLDQLSLLSGEITVEKVWDLVGAVPERDLISLLEAINSGDTAIILDCIRQLLNRGREPLIVLQNLAGFYRDLLIAKSAPDRPDLVALTQPTWEKLCQFSQHWDHAIILAGQKHLRESEAQIKHTTQPRLWLEITLLGLLPAALQKSVIPQTVSVVQTPQTTVQTPPQYVQRSEPSPPPQNPVNVPVYQPTSNPEPQPQVKAEIPATPPEPPIVIDGNIEQIWQQVLAYVQPFGTQQMFRQQGRLIQYNAGVAMIKMASSTLLKMAQTKQKLSSLEKAFQQVFGHPVKINFDTGGGTSAYRVQEVTPPSPSYSPVETSRVSSPEISPNSSINHQEQQQISSSPDQDIRESDQIDQVKMEREMETGKMPVPLEKVELTPEEMDAQAVLMASQKLAEFFKGQMIDLGEKQTSKTAILLSQKDDIVDSSEDDNFIESDEIEEDNYDDF